jgi:thioredoxin-like negative regulator of GroEL
MLTNIEEVQEVIAKNKYTTFIWHSNDCPVCEYFLDDIKNIHNDLPNWSVNIVCVDDYDNVTFEPDSYPTTFLFKDGKRVFIGAGQVPYKEVLRLHNDIETDKFKHATPTPL